jgi:hypothetical protein
MREAEAGCAMQQYERRIACVAVPRKLKALGAASAVRVQNEQQVDGCGRPLASKCGVGSAAQQRFRINRARVPADRVLWEVLDNAVCGVCCTLEQSSAVQRTHQAPDQAEALLILHQILQRSGLKLPILCTAMRLCPPCIRQA